MEKRILPLLSLLCTLLLGGATFAKEGCLSDLEVLNLIEGEACSAEGQFIQDIERLGHLPQPMLPYPEQQAFVLAQVGFWGLTEAQNATAEFGLDASLLRGMAIDPLRKSPLLAMVPTDQAETTGAMVEKQTFFFFTLVGLEKHFTIAGTAPENERKAKDWFAEMQRYLTTDVRPAGLLGAACLWKYDLPGVSLAAASTSNA